MIIIESKSNSLFKNLKKLKDKKKYRDEKKQYIIEGFRFVKEAIKSNTCLECVIFTEDFYKKEKEFLSETIHAFSFTIYFIFIFWFTFLYLDSFFCKIKISSRNWYFSVLRLQLEIPIFKFYCKITLQASFRRSICQAALAGLVEGSFSIGLPVTGKAYFW